LWAIGETRHEALVHTTARVEESTNDRSPEKDGKRKISFGGVGEIKLLDACNLPPTTERPGWAFLPLRNLSEMSGWRDAQPLHASGTGT